MRAGAELIGHLVAEIFQHWELDFAGAHELRDLGQAVLLIGIDRHELHAFGFITLGQFRQSRSVKPCHRALGPQERDDDRFLVTPIGQRMLRAKVILQLEIGDLLPERY